MFQRPAQHATNRLADDDLGSHLHQVIKLGDVLVQHPDAARRDVLADRHRPDEALQAAVLGHVGDAETARLARRSDADRVAVERDRTGTRRGDPEDRQRQLGATGADEAGEAEDLALSEVEVDAGEGDGVGGLGVARGGEGADGEATALLLSRELSHTGAQVSRIASGVPHGSDLEFADQVTLGRAISGRRASS